MKEELLKLRARNKKNEQDEKKRVEENEKLAKKAADNKKRGVAGELFDGTVKKKVSQAEMKRQERKERLKF